MELPFFVVYWLLFVLAVLAGLFVVFRLIFRNRSDVGGGRIFGYSILSLLVFSRQINIWRGLRPD